MPDTQQDQGASPPGRYQWSPKVIAQATLRRDYCQTQAENLMSAAAFERARGNHEWADHLTWLALAASLDFLGWEAAADSFVADRTSPSEEFLDDVWHWEQVHREMRQRWAQEAREQKYEACSTRRRIANRTATTTRPRERRSGTPRSVARRTKRTTSSSRSLDDPAPGSSDPPAANGRVLRQLLRLALRILRFDAAAMGASRRCSRCRRALIRTADGRWVCPNPQCEGEL